MQNRIFLSPPHMGGEELSFINEAFEANYIAPVGPQLDAFEKEFAKVVGAKHSVAVSSGTAALHLLLRYLGVGKGEEVFCSTFTFVATANPVLYCGARPVFIDSEQSSWNMDPVLLKEALAKRAQINKLPKAVVLVHLYGQSADLDSIKRICDEYSVPLIEDAAEALGAFYKDKYPGTIGLAGFFSFNGNKIITTSGGGMIVSDNKNLVDKVRFWATQARENEVYYEHREVGYNYRMSNVLAAIGRGQLKMLGDRVREKRNIYRRYYKQLSGLAGVQFMPEPEDGRATRWLTCLTIDPDFAQTDRDIVIQELENHNIESRPTWKPMHMQPLFKEYDVIGGDVSEKLFREGLCLPSGTSMSEEDQDRVIAVVKSCWE